MRWIVYVDQDTKNQVDFGYSKGLWASGKFGKAEMTENKFHYAYSDYISFLIQLDEEKLDKSITHKRYCGKYDNFVFWNLKENAEFDERFRTSSGSYFKDEAGDIKLKFMPGRKFDKKYERSKFLSLIKNSYFIGITHVNDVELVVAYAMLRANPEWETKLEKEIGQPFYGKEKLNWQDVKGATVRTITTPLWGRGTRRNTDESKKKRGPALEFSPLGKFFHD